MGRRDTQAKAIKDVAKGADFELVPAVAGNATMKAAVFGQPGTGKSFSTSAIAIGLHDFIGSEKPVALLDTERGSDYLIKQYKHNDIKIVRHMTRAFSALVPFIEKASEVSDIAIIDSVTHFWIDLCDSYRKAVGRKSLQIDDWGILKEEWKRFMETFINSGLHLFMLGRGGYEYDYMTDDAGKQVLIKSGTKMVAEKNTQFEPSLTIEMLQTIYDDANKTKMLKDAAKGIQPDIGGKVAFFEMIVLKDRSNTLTGSRFVYHAKPGVYLEKDNRVWSDVRPFVEELCIGGVEGGVSVDDSSDIFGREDRSASEFRKQQETMVDELGGILNRHYSSTGGLDKKCKLELYVLVFNTHSKKAIERRGLPELRLGREQFEEYIAIAKDKGPDLLDKAELAGYDVKDDPEDLAVFALTGQVEKFEDRFVKWQKRAGKKAVAVAAVEEKKKREARIVKLFALKKLTADHVEELLELTGFNPKDPTFDKLLTAGNLSGAVAVVRAKVEEVKT